MAMLSELQQRGATQTRGVPGVEPGGRPLLDRTGMDENRLARGLGWFSIGLGLAELIAPRFVARLVGSRNHGFLIRTYGLRELGVGVGILTSRRPEPWLWARVAGDALDLGSLGAVLGANDRGRGRTALGVAAVAGVTALDYMCAEKLDAAAGRTSARAETSMIVNRPPEECYRFWRNFENLPRFMTYLRSVTVSGDRLSHWVANLPGGRPLEWDAEIEDDIPGRRISWHSLPGSDLSNSGSVEFEAAPGSRGTIVRVQMDYGTRAHALGSRAAALVGKDPEQVIRKELHRFKQALETGEVITTEGQPTGRRSSVAVMDTVAR